MIEFDLTDDDYVAFQLHMRTLTQPSVAVRVAMGVGVVALIWVIGFFTMEPGDDVPGVVILSLIVSLVVGGVLWAIDQVAPRQALRSMAQHIGLGLTGRFQVYLTEDGLVQRGVDYTETLGWSLLRTVDVTSEHAFILLSGGGVILPLRGQPDAVRAFAEEARRRLAAAPHR